ncbi:HprK-related kinase B [Marinomonas algarum]|uniref:HprK-related kinase B n=1 Tax=Marinomonas algarum TaxID=2883105 RepID=A0A9X1INR5_9GAMM|nr:HprK-related kinase B [Marinomonas algarum]MCB5162347.1 HprK-related kinase B [Marinomonas algarum]
MIKALLNLPHVDDALSRCTNTIQLAFADLSITVHSNETMLLAGIADYYRSYLKLPTTLKLPATLKQTTAPTTALQVFAIEQDAVGEELNWLDVPREAGKQGRKEGYLDVEGGRWIKKFKTGMVFLQRPDQVVAVGPCSANVAQIINFINNQFLNHYLRQGFSLGHASGFSVKGEVTAIAAGSGGGKSTLMLRCLENPERNFLTNDRILIKKTAQGTATMGLAKLPRVNPGTLLHADRLRHILPEARQAALREMPQSELWSLEEKYDVQIEDEYGADRVCLTGHLSRLVMLDWSLNSPEPTCLERVDLATQPDVIEGLRKRPGPFYQDNEGVFADLNAIDSVAHYADELANVTVYRLTGKIDFDRAYELIAALDPA